MRFTTHLLLPLLLLSSCSTCSRSAEESIRQQMENALDSVEAAMEGQFMRDSIDAARAEQLNYLIDSIRAQDYNENSNATMYFLDVHKTWDKELDRNRNGIMVVVKEKIGGIAIISTLQGKHKPLHNRIVFEIDSKTYTVDSNMSYSMNMYNREHGYTHLPDAVGEVLWVEEEFSLPIVQAIAANPAAEIKVTVYCNNEVYASYTVSETDKLAIIASFKFLLMIKERNALEGGNVEWDD